MDIENAVFNSVMRDITGKHRLESEDPKWSELFRCLDILSIRGNEPAWLVLGERFVSNNPFTGNLISLLEKTLSRSRQVIAKKNTPSSSSIEQCCVSFHLSALLIHYFTAALPPHEFRKQLGLPSTTSCTIISRGPSNTHSISSNPFAHGEVVLLELIEEAVELLYSTSHMNWLCDVYFYSASLLLCMLSSQLFRPGADADNVCMSYIFALSEQQMQDASSRPDIDVTGALPCKLIRGLMAHAVSSQVFMSQGLLMDYGQRLSGTQRASTLASAPSAISLPAQEPSSEPTLAESRSVVASSSNDESVQPTGGGEGGQHALWTQIGVWLGTPLSVLKRLASFYVDEYTAVFAAISYGTSGNDDKDAGRLSTLLGDIYLQGSASPLAERCLSVLHILLHNRRSLGQSGQGFSACARRNPFRQAFCMLHDEEMESMLQGDEEELCAIKFSPQEVKLHIEFKVLTNIISKHISSVNYGLLLYSLLQFHPTYLPSIVASGSVTPLLVALLEQMYHIKREVLSAEVVPIEAFYLLVINSLMIVQDATLRPVLCKLPMESDLKWYAEKKLKNQTIGDLAILCVLRATVNCLVGINDSYLLTNTVAIIMDLAPNLQGISSYTGERIVAVTMRLTRRYIKMIAVINKRRSMARKHLEMMTRQSPHVDYTTSLQPDTNILPGEETLDTDSVHVVRSGDAYAADFSTILPRDYSGMSSQDGSLDATADTLCPSGGSMTIGLKKTTQQDSYLPDDIESKVESIEECLQALMLLIGCALREGRRKSNVNLLYALVRSHDSICSLLSDPYITNLFHEPPGECAADFVDNADSAADPFSPFDRSHRARIYSRQISVNRQILTPSSIIELTASSYKVLEEAAEGVGIRRDGGLKNASEALSILMDSIQDGKSDHLPRADEVELTYTYEEGDNPEDFFLPYVWENATKKSSDIAWDWNKVELFDVCSTNEFAQQLTSESLGFSLVDTETENPADIV